MSSYRIQPSKLILCLFLCLPFFLLTASSSRSQEAESEESAQSIVSVEGKDIEVNNIEGGKYISLDQLSKKIGLSVKYFADSKMYKVVGKDKKEIKFVLNKRAVVVDDKYFKSKDPVIKAEDDVQIPLEMVSSIFEVSEGEKKPATDKKSETVKKENDKGKDVKDKAKTAENHEEIVVEEENPESENVKVVIGDAETTGETAIAKNSETKDKGAVTEETAIKTTTADLIIENVKYRRGKESFELDITFDKAPSMDNIKFSLDPDGTILDIRVNKADSKLGEQTIKIAENIIKSVKLTMAQQEKSNKVILSVNSGAKVKVSSRQKGNTVTFVMSKPDSELTPVISEDAKNDTSAVAVKTVLPEIGDSKNAADDKKLPPPEDSKSKNQVAVKIKNLEEIIAPVQNMDCIITINAGHGGEEFGVVSETRLKEKDVALDIAKRLKTIIDKTKMRALLVRTGDYFMPLENRLKFVNTYETKVYISIHAGSSPAQQASGIGIFYYDINGGKSETVTPAADIKTGSGATGTIDAQVNEILMSMSTSQKIAESKALADKMSEAFKKMKTMKIRKVRGARIAELSDCMMPAVIVETGFLTNHEDEKALGTDEHNDEVALAIFEGMRDFLLSSKKK